MSERCKTAWCGACGLRKKLRPNGSFYNHGLVANRCPGSQRRPAEVSELQPGLVRLTTAQKAAVAELLRDGIALEGLERGWKTKRYDYKSLKGVLRAIVQRNRDDVASAAGE